MPPTLLNEPIVSTSSGRGTVTTRNNRQSSRGDGPQVRRPRRDRIPPPEPHNNISRSTSRIRSFGRRTADARAGEARSRRTVGAEPN